MSIHPWTSGRTSLRLGGVNPNHAMAVKHVAYDKVKILRVTRDGLEYLDDQGITCTIDFHTCHECVQRELRRPGWVQVGESQDIYVGFRDFSATPPLFTFGSDPQTRFEFPASADFRDFYELEVCLIKAGVRTLDMA
jgi:hypothetical protein